MSLSSREKLIRKLRRQMRGPVRWLRVEYVEPGVEKHTCQTCGHEEIVCITPFAKKTGARISEQLAKKLAAYRNQGRGIQGTCSACTKKARDERYPLSKKEE